MLILSCLIILNCFLSGCTRQVTLPEKPDAEKVNGSKEQQRETGTIFTTWESRGDSYPLIEEYTWVQPPPDLYPVAGIASHHLLAGSMIDRFFSDLKELREVSTFLIISPLHWDLDEQEAVSTLGSWNTPGGAVENSKPLSLAIIENLHIRPNDTAFLYEHGVAVFMPFIKRYFPKARVSVLAVPGEPPVNVGRVQSICEAVCSVLEEEDIFLLVSSDFSHHGNSDSTQRKDALSRDFLMSPDGDSWVFAGCDNRPGMYIYGRLAERFPGSRSSVLSNSNSYLISGEGEQDITSYFFTLLGRFTK